MCTFTMEFNKLTIIIVILPVIVSGDWDWETIAPQDMANCDLRYDTVYSWLVRIWNHQNKKSEGHGSLLTHRAVMTSCALYENLVIENYKIIGQNVWNLSDPVHLCTQTAEPAQFIKHPKCIDGQSPYFNYGIWTLKVPFRIIGTVYPTFQHSIDPDRLLTTLQFINAATTYIGCDLPYFPALEEKLSFDLKSLVQSIPWQTECIKLACEKNPADQGFSSSCEQTLRERADGTLLCMYPTLVKVIPTEPDPEKNSWYAGAPLVCNDTVYGISSQVKYRNAFPTAPQDFHMVATLLRVWVWLMRVKAHTSLPLTGDAYVVADKNLERSKFLTKPPPEHLRRYKPSEIYPSAPARRALTERMSCALSARSDAMMVSCMVAFIMIFMPRHQISCDIQFA